MTWILIIIAILLLPIVYDLLIPLKRPDLKGTFKVGQEFESKTEGVTQRILRVDGERIFSQIILDPGSPGPPEHVHLTMHESATISEGELDVKLNGETKRMRAGERLFLPPGQYHTFSNPTDSQVVITCDQDTDYVPAGFMYGLSKLYMILDGPAAFRPLRILLQLSVLGDMFDNYIAGPPIPVQKSMQRVLRPYARVLGFS